MTPTNFLVGLLAFVATAYACTQDWECGNPVYFDCVQEQPVCTLINGVGISPNRVYWLERCVQGGNSTVYLVRAGTLIQEVAVIAENPDADSSDAITVESLVSANFRAVYVLKSGRFGNYLYELTAYYETYTPEAPAVSTHTGIPIDAAFDFDENFQGTPVASYVCLGDSIVKYDTLNFTTNDNSTLLYQTACTYISFFNGSIYWATIVYNSVSASYETQFFQGDTECNNCTVPQPFATLPDTFNDFEVANGRLYFARQNMGIQSISLTSSDLSTAQSLVSAGNVNGFKISGGSRIWFNDGISIQGINLDKSDLSTISSISAAAEGSCLCSGGFSGANCDECPNNGSVQWSNGIPQCVPLNVATGFPASCVADYNCGNVPYTRCNEVSATCECATGTFGVPPACNTCSNGATITWDNGTPSCSSAAN